MMRTPENSIDEQDFFLQRSLTRRLAAVFCGLAASSSTNRDEREFLEVAL